MKPLVFLFAVFIVACSKDSGIRPEKQNNNLVKAKVTVTGRVSRNFDVKGVQTDFYRTGTDAPLYDTVYSLDGHDGEIGVHLNLWNLKSPGTYDFVVKEDSVMSGTFASYSEFKPGAPSSSVYTTQETDSLGNQLSAGTYTIISMNDKEIEATMQVLIRSADGFEVRLDSVYFKGVYEKF